MNLFVIRHAIAEDRSHGTHDAERALTPRGRERFELAVRGMQRLGLEFDEVLHSPWRRARETAELLARVCSGEVRESEGLAAPPSPDLLAQLNDHPADGSLALVGHEPWVSELVAWLVTAEPERGVDYAMKKGAVAWLAGAPVPGGMALGGYFAPKTLRRAGRVG